MNNTVDIRDHFWPGAPLACVERHDVPPAHVDANCRQSPLGADALSESLVGESPCTSPPAAQSTSPIPYAGGIFEISFDFVDHKLDIATSDGQAPDRVALRTFWRDFYREFIQLLRSLNVRVKIWPMPVEIQNPIRFDRDVTHCTYDPAYALPLANPYHASIRS